MNLPDEQLSSCSLLSARMGEPLTGTAPQAQIYILVEYTSEWSDKALESSEISANVKNFLQGVITSQGPGKILLIKQSFGIRTTKKHIFIAIVSETNPRLFEFAITDYEDILTIDLVGLINGTTDFTQNRVFRPMYLICTNGRRDRCCAKEGFQVYKSFHDHVGDAVWECSHVGGHRFAANVITLPDGVLYGRVHADMVTDLVTACNNSRLIPEWMRGRTIYPSHIQAAEGLLRQKTNRQEIYTYQFGRSTELGENRWDVSFTEISSGHEYNLKLRKVSTEKTVLESCSQDKYTPVIHYELESI